MLEYGTGNSIPDPPVFVPYPGQQPDSASSHSNTSNSNSKTTPGSRPAQFVRASARPAPAYQTDQDGLVQSPEVQAQAPAQPAPTRGTPERGDSTQSQSQLDADAGSLRGGGGADYVERGQVDPAVGRGPNGTHVVNASVASVNGNGNGYAAGSNGVNNTTRTVQQPPPSTWQPEPEQAAPKRLSAPLPPMPQTQTPYQDNPPNRAPTPPPDEGGRILFYGASFIRVSYEQS